MPEIEASLPFSAAKLTRMAAGRAEEEGAGGEQAQVKSAMLLRGQQCCGICRITCGQGGVAADDGRAGGAQEGEGRLGAVRPARVSLSLSLSLALSLLGRLSVCLLLLLLLYGSKHECAVRDTGVEGRACRRCAVCDSDRAGSRVDGNLAGHVG
eukprot:560799-Rhodomonas_salina.3